MTSAGIGKPLQDYEHVEPANNINLSLNQILGLPYQIVMPQTEINQSISINHLPSLNDLAIRTGINAGMSQIFAAPRPMLAPSPVPLSSPQLILPLSSLYSAPCTKDHMQLPIPMLSTYETPLIETQQTHATLPMHSKPPSQHSYFAFSSPGINNNLIPNPSY